MDNAEWDEAGQFIPIIISYDELTDMWSYTIDDISGIADTKQELVEKVWDLIYSWKYGEV